MKAIKKLVAILLSVMMLLGLVIIPSSAEDVAADTLVTREYSLFDLSEATVGASTVDDADALPEGVAEGGIERYNNISGYSNATFYSGTQSVVNVDGQNMLKVVFDKAANLGNNGLDGAKGVYSLKVKIPEGLGSYVTNVNIEFKDHGKLGGNLKYMMGILGDGKAAAPGAGAKWYGAETGGVTFNVADFDTFPTVYTATLKGSSWATNQCTGKWGADSNPSNAEEVFLIFASEAAKEDGGTGYVLLKDIRVTVTAPQAIHDDPIITKTVNLLDFSDYALGEIEAADYPDGVAEYAFPDATNTFTGKGGKKYVAEHNGKKVLQLDLKHR